MIPRGRMKSNWRSILFKIMIPTEKKLGHSEGKEYIEGFLRSTEP